MSFKIRSVRSEVKSKKEGMFLLFIIPIVRHSFHYLFKKPSPTRLWSPVYLQPLTADTGRSSRTEVFCKKGVLRNFAKFTELKKSLWHRCFL